MQVRFLVFAMIGLSLADQVSAEPPKPSATAAESSQPRRAPVVLASADHVPTTSVEASSGPVKHRAARVTTCRCGGDPQPEPDEKQ